MDSINIFEDFDLLDDDLEVVEFLVVGLPRSINLRSEFFSSLDQETFYKRFRFTKQGVLRLLALIERDLEYYHDRNRSLSPMNQILLTLRYYATGNHLLSIADFAGSTVSRVVLRVSTAIANHMRTFVKFPDSSEEIQKAKAKFYKIASFPGVIGAVDGTHVKIQSPGGNDAEIFRNRKGYFSINVQAVCNSELEVLDLVARWPGSTHDATVFGNSRVKSCFENNLYPDCILLDKHYSLDRVLISHKNISGDSGYAIKPYLMTPLANPTTPGEKLYNESHIRTRNVIERMFGVWKRRFPVLAYGCRLKLSTTLIVIVATCVLHNIARQMGMADPSGSDDFEDTELFNAIKAGEMFERDTHTQSNNASNNAGMTRRRHLLAEHFSRL